MVFLNFILPRLADRVIVSCGLSHRVKPRLVAFAQKYIRSYKRGTLDSNKKRLLREYAGEGVSASALKIFADVLDSFVKTRNFKFICEFEERMRQILDERGIPPLTRLPYYGFANKAVRLMMTYAEPHATRAVEITARYFAEVYGLDEETLREIAQLINEYLWLIEWIGGRV